MSREASRVQWYRSLNACDGAKVDKADGDGNIWVNWIAWIERLVEHADGYVT